MIISVFGHGRKCGKTTTVEVIVRELTKRNYKVGCIKKIHIENFTIDKEGKDSYRHAKAGAKLVATASPKEIAIIRKIQDNPVEKALELMLHDALDFVIIEGRYDKAKIKIPVARSYEEAKKILPMNFLFISSLTPEKFPSFLKVLHPLKDAEKMVEMVISQSNISKTSTN